MKNLPKYFEQTENINIEPYRCYYVPFSKEDEFSFDRNKSSKFTLLNGQWQIKKYLSFYDLPNDFLSLELDESIPVPSCVQLYGYDNPQYVNQDYPYAFNPPYVNNENPTYHYRKTVNISLDGEEKYLVFEGVDSCFYLFVNGEFVGYSQITHKLTEFNITPYLKDGENVLDVIVLKWCASSYLEDQDKWRFTGIFRDVYLLSRSTERVVDYLINTTVEGELTFTILKGSQARVTFNGQTKTANPNEKISFYIENPNLWSAEVPNLYDLLIECGNEVIFEQVGFRECKVQDGVLYFNNTPIKLYGVNRHDFNCHTGATVTIENMIEDLTLMKKLNVNAIRTSHYPNAPEFYKLCDRFGFYVMSESDYETHGVVNNVAKLGYNVEAFHTISDMPLYKSAIVERQIANVKCNVNRPCVYSWSLGNESGWGQCLVEAAKTVRALDSTRPIHYEGIFFVKDKDEYYTDLIDTASRMYPPYEFFEEFLSDEREKRPLVLCEYSHSMGNGPGDIHDYWEMIEKSDRFTGGFIWEWADHGLVSNGKEFLYGGDFGETLNDGNFCIDGIVSADRKIKRGTLEMKHAYQPIKFEYSKNYLVLFNKNFFKALSLKVIVQDEFEDKTFMININPRETVKLRIGGKLNFNAHAYLVDTDEKIANFTYVNKYIAEKSVVKTNVKVRESGRFLYVMDELTEYVFDTLSGEIATINLNGKKITDYFKFNIIRAPMDNDRLYKNDWETERYFYSRSEVRKYEYSDGVLTFTGDIVSDKFYPLISYRLRYSFCANGVNVELKYTQNEDFSLPPRIGLCTELPESFNLIEYLGYGEGETYVDMHRSADFGYYTTCPESEFHHYVKPQESGSHYGTRKLQVSSIDNSLVVDGEISFSCVPYSINQLKKTAHDFELKKEGKYYLNIDFFMAGSGSNSCGPNIMQKYCVPKKGKKSFIISVK
ncbi:MAG: hypothetical protein IKB67_02725 [Clostridia bacterium]|nr:hypothetical protein [Clostridia bacterium]